MTSTAPDYTPNPSPTSLSVSIRLINEAELTWDCTVAIATKNTIKFMGRHMVIVEIEKKLRLKLVITFVVKLRMLKTFNRY